MLTQKQETFTIEYYKTGHATNSAIVAGYAPRAAYAMASENLTKPKIIARLAELRSPPVNSAKMEVQEREERLSEIGREDITTLKGTPLRAPNISAIAELNKMGGDYAPVKTDHTFNGEGLAEVLGKLRGYKQLEQGKK